MLKLRSERLARKWSMTLVSGMTGIATSDLSQLERGLRPAYPGWKSRLARAFKVPADELFAKADNHQAVDAGVDR